MIRQSKTYIAIPPGETIKECLKYHGISYLRFAEKTELPLKNVFSILEGEQKITVDIADRLERFFGISHGFWLRLEAIYREKLELVEEENANGK